MIREGIKLPENAIKKLPKMIGKISADKEITALFVFGSAAQEDLKPLSDLDFAILLSSRLNAKQRFKKHLDLIGLFTDTFNTDEIDLVVMNDAPPRFSLDIIRTGKLLFVQNRKALVDFQEQQNKSYFDFKYYRDEFDLVFLKGIGFYG